MIDPQVVREGVSIVVRHLVAVEIDLEAEAVPRLRAVDAARLRAALLHVARVLGALALARPVLALRVLVRAARVRRGGEREQSESWYSSRHRVDFRCDVRARLDFAESLVAAKLC